MQTAPINKRHQSAQARQTDGAVPFSQSGQMTSLFAQDTRQKQTSAMLQKARIAGFVQSIPFVTSKRGKESAADNRSMKEVNEIKSHCMRYFINSLLLMSGASFLIWCHCTGCWDKSLPFVTIAH